jgi:hypothetical protein
MIAAFQDVADAASLRERERTVCAAIGERMDRAIGGPKEHDRFVEEPPRQESVLKLAAEGGNLPTRSQPRGSRRHDDHLPLVPP